MERFIEFVKENIRFVLAVLMNIVALLVALVWMVNSNWNTNGQIEMEPIVTFLALCATLLGLNFVNDKLTKPHIKVKMTMAMAKHPTQGVVTGISVTLENHSMIKAFIKNFQVQLPETKQVLQFCEEGFTGIDLPKVILEPGQAFSFNMVKRNFAGTPENIKSYGDFVVTTDTGYKFVVPAKIFREHLALLLNIDLDSH